MIKKSIYILLLLGAVALVALAVITKEQRHSLLPKIEFNLFNSAKAEVEQIETTPTATAQSELTETAEPTIAADSLITE